MHRAKLSAGSGLLWVMCALAAGGTAFAQARETRLWYQAYEDGVRAIQKQDWQGAISSLQAALKLRPQQGRRVLFYGDRIDVYIPDYYLGVAYMNLRRFPEADAAFQRVQQQGLMTAADALYKTFQTQAATARFETRMAAAEQLLASGNLDRASQEAAALAASGGDRARIENLQTRIASAAQKPPVAQQAPVPQVVSVPDLRGLDAAGARRALDAAQLRLGSITERESFAAAGSILDQAVAPGARVPPASAVDVVLARAAAAAPPPPAKEEPAPAKTPESPPARAGAVPAPRDLPAPLPAIPERAAIRAFFDGDYQSAAQMLGAIAAGANASPRARFYLACSLAALVVTGDRGTESTAEARRQLAMAGPLDQYAVDRRLVSPRLLSILGVRP